MEVYLKKLGTSCLGPCRLSLVVFHLRTPVLKCFYYFLWSYFLTKSEFSCFAKLAKPYPVSGPTPMRQIPKQLHYHQKSAHEVLRYIYGTRVLPVFTQTQLFCL